MGLWDSVTGFFEDLGDFFSGKDFFECAGYAWNDMMQLASDVLTKNPAKGTYKDVWESISTIYTTLNVVAVSLLCVFFLYGFCRDSCDLHTDLTFDKTIKMFIRLIITSNVLSMALTYGVYLALTPPGRGKAIRSYRLSDGYMPEDIDRRIDAKAGKSLLQKSGKRTQTASKLDWAMSRNYQFVPYKEMSDYQKAMVRQVLEARRLYRRTGTPLYLHEQSVRVVQRMKKDTKQCGIYIKRKEVRSTQKELEKVMKQSRRNKTL